MSVGTKPLVLSVADGPADPGPSIYLAYPYSRPHPDGFLRSVAYLAAIPGYGGLQLAPLYGFALDVARNALVKGFLESGCDFLLCVDNDARFDPRAVLRLLGHNLPMVCGCMYTRSLPPKSTVGKYIGQTRKGTHLYSFSEVMRRTVELARKHGITHQNAENDLLLPEPQLMEVDGCGMHFTLIRRDVVEALAPPYFQFLGTTTAGEDFYFCRKVKAAGFPIYVDLSVQTGHILDEEHDYGIREILYLSQYLPLDDICDDETSLEVGL